MLSPWLPVPYHSRCHSRTRRGTQLHRSLPSQRLPQPVATFKNTWAHVVCLVAGPCSSPCTSTLSCCTGNSLSMHSDACVLLCAVLLFKTNSGRVIESANVFVRPVAGGMEALHRAVAQIYGQPTAAVIPAEAAERSQVRIVLLSPWPAAACTHCAWEGRSHFSTRL